MPTRDSGAEWAALDELQRRVLKWQNLNFPDCAEWELALGVAEEAGEVADYVLKSHRHIRAQEFPEERLKDAVGDLIIYLFGICEAHDWLLSEIANGTVDKVLTRNWT
jgi:NTP pyrophosphatase (non-canonical NTP hydrolase)